METVENNEIKISLFWAVANSSWEWNKKDLKMICITHVRSRFTLVVDGSLGLATISLKN